MSHGDNYRLWSTEKLDYIQENGRWYYRQSDRYARQKFVGYVNSDDIEVTRKTRNSVKLFAEPNNTTYKSIVLPTGQYEVEVTRLTPEDDPTDQFNESQLNVRFIEEINSTDVNYGGIGLVGFNLKAQAQLSGQRPNFKVVTTRAPLFIEGEYRDSSNPAWVCYDILTNSSYGMAVEAEALDFKQFEAWAAFCDPRVVTDAFTISKITTDPFTVTPEGRLVVPVSDVPLNEVMVLTQIQDNNSYLRIQRTDGRDLLLPDITNIELINTATGSQYEVTFKEELTNVEEVEYSITFNNDVAIETPKLSFNGVFDSSTDIWSSLQDVAAVGRGQVILQGSRYSVIFDAPRMVTGLYNASNSKDVVVSYIGSSDIATEVEVQFSDANLGYEMNQVSIQDISAIEAGVKPNKTTIQVKGITTETEALVHGRYLLATSKALRRSVTFEADIEAISQTVGDVIAVQTDVTDYGVGGNIVSVVGNTVTLGELVNVTAGVTYTLKVKDRTTDVITDYTYVPGVTNTSTDSITLTNATGINPNDGFTFGVVNSDSFLCTIVDISRDGELTRQISAIEYNESILDFDYDNDIIQRNTPTVRPTNVISNLTASDRLVKSDSGDAVAVISFTWETTTASLYNLFTIVNDSKEYLSTYIEGTSYDFVATGYIPEQEYTFYVEDVQDIGVYTELPYTITAFSSPPEDLDSVVITPSGNKFEVVVTYSNKPLDFSHYNVYHLGTLVGTSLTDTFEIPGVSGLGSKDFFIEAVDVIGKVSNQLQYNVVIAAPTVGSFSYKFYSDYVEVTPTNVVSAFDVKHYTYTYEGVESTVTANTFNIALVGTVSPLHVQITDVLGNVGTLLQDNVVVQLPTISNINLTGNSDNILVDVVSVKGSFDIKEYVYTYNGDTTVASNQINIKPLNEVAIPLVVKAIDYLGNVGPESSVLVSLNKPQVTFPKYTHRESDTLIEYKSIPGTFDIDHYVINYEGLQFTTKDKFFNINPEWLGSSLVSITPVDLLGLQGDVVNLEVITTAPIVSGINSSVDSDIMNVYWNITPGSFSVSKYIVTYNGSTVETTDTFINIPADWSGTENVSVTAVDVRGNTSDAALKGVIINVPGSVNLTSSITGKDAIIKWDIPQSDVSIDYYEVTYDAITINVKTTSHSIPVFWEGSKTFFVRAIASLGQIGLQTSTEVIVTTGVVTNFQAEVIDNNVLLRWASTQGSLPIENFLLYKGDIATPTVIGEKKGTFTTVFENEAGVYSYHLAAIDSAGNEGAKSTVTTNVSEPPDYVLNVLWESDFSGTKSNAVVDVDTNYLVMPLITGETIQEHFTNNSWTTPQDQINAGYPKWVEPYNTTSYYEEVFDYGTILASTLVTVTPDTFILDGTPTLVTDISISQDGISYTDFPGQNQVYGTSFRYVKVRITVTGTNSALELRALQVKLDTKIKNDSGTGNAVAADSGGTTVLFNKTFVDITSITVTPSGTTPRIAIYDFVDVPNPTEFKVLLYDTNGVRQDGAFSWAAKGS